MAGEGRRGGIQWGVLARWSRPNGHSVQYGLGAVLLAVLVPAAFGVPDPQTPFPNHIGEIVLAIGLIAVFANLVLVMAARIGDSRREWWFALGGLGLVVAHPVLDGLLVDAAGWVRPARLIIGALAVAALTTLVASPSWPARALRAVALTLSLFTIAAAMLVIDAPSSAPGIETAGVAFGLAAAALGGVAFIYGQRWPDGALMSFGMTALSVGYGEIILLSSGDVQLTVGLAVLSVVAAVTALTAAVMSLFEALSRRELRREATALSRDLAVARLEAQASRFSELAHDQRSALLAIEAAAQQMRSQPSGDLAAAVASEAARLNRLLAERATGVQRFDLPAAVMPMVECMRTFGSEIGVVVHDDVSVWGDVDEIVEIVGVLIDNALTHGMAPVRVEIDAVDGAGLLRVVDAGPGVPQPLRDSVFERGVTTAPSSNSGLGLYSARRMAEAAGGSLTIADHDAAFELVVPTNAPAVHPDVDADPDEDVGSIEVIDWASDG